MHIISLRIWVNIVTKSVTVDALLLRRRWHQRNTCTATFTFTDHQQKWLPLQSRTPRALKWELTDRRGHKCGYCLCYFVWLIVTFLVSCVTGTPASTARAKTTQKSDGDSVFAFLGGKYRVVIVVVVELCKYHDYYIHKQSSCMTPRAPKGHKQPWVEISPKHTNVRDPFV